MSIFDIFSGSNATINCSHCDHKYNVQRPKPLKKKVYESAEWHLENLDEELSNLYIYEFSEVTSSTCPNCKNLNYLYLDSRHKLIVSKEKPKDTYLTKELLEHWIEKS